MNAITVIKPSWLKEVVQSYNTDPKGQELLLNLSTQSEELPDYSYANGIIIFKVRIFIGNANGLKERLVTCMHSSHIGGHFGNLGTYQRIKT